MKPTGMLTSSVVGCTVVLLVWSAGTQGKTLPVPLVTQEQSQWCWAAVSKSTLGYYQYTISQCEIAEYTRSVATWYNFGSTNCCVNPNLGCNYWNYNWGFAGSIEDILLHWGVSSYGAYPLSGPEVAGEIDANRPFIINWQWSSGGGHFIVGRGFDGATLEYMDPWYGEGYKAASYDWVVSGSNHTWAGTNRMSTNCQCTEAGSCCNGCWFNPEYSPCDDGSLCTRYDDCSAGVCRGLSPVVCAAQDQCHDVGVCDPLTGGCSNPSKTNGSPCDDANGCTNGDSCQGGACISGAPVTCAALDQCHETGVCDSLTGTCSNPPKLDGLTCNDGNACTRIDVCLGGICSGGDPVICAEPDQCHDAGACDPLTGSCSNPPKTNGSPCDDGNGCTGGDSCQEGICVSGTPVVCTPLDQCHDAGSCVPGSGVCSNPAKADESGCDDGNACTRKDVCQGGVCSGGEPTVCAALDQCHAAGVCDPLTGSCPNPPRANGSSCDDGNGCTRGDICQGGVCISGEPVVCPLPDQCHDAGVCDRLTGNCSNPPKADGTRCDDGNAPCTNEDMCRDGVCQGVAFDCNDFDPCTSDICDPGAGCVHDPLPDGNECGSCHVCRQGSCVAAEDCTAIVGGCGTTGAGGMPVDMGVLLLLPWIALGLARHRKGSTLRGVPAGCCRGNLAGY